MDEITKEAKKLAREGKKEAWSIYQSHPIRLKNEVLPLLKAIQTQGEKGIFITNTIKELESHEDLEVAHSFKAVRKALRTVSGDRAIDVAQLKSWLSKEKAVQRERYSSHLYSVQSESALLDYTPVEYATQELVDARIILRDNFDALFTKYP